MTKSEPTFYAEIFIAGDAEQAKQVCREACMAEGLCVTVERVSFIYTGGQEEGVKVGLTNYPRFPTAPAVLLARAEALANALRSRLCQHSYMIRCADISHWYSVRET